MKQCERCGRLAYRLGADGWCDPCAERLREAEEGGDDATAETPQTGDP